MIVTVKVPCEISIHWTNYIGSNGSNLLCTYRVTLFGRNLFPYASKNFKTEKSAISAAKKAIREFSRDECEAMVANGKSS